MYIYTYKTLGVKSANRSEGDATPLLPSALRYLLSHLRLNSAAPNVPHSHWRRNLSPWDGSSRPTFWQQINIFLRGNALIVNQRRVQNVSQRVRKLFQTVSTRDNFNFHCSCTFMTTCVSETSCRGKLLSRPNNYKKITLSLR